MKINIGDTWKDVASTKIKLDTNLLDYSNWISGTTGDVGYWNDYVGWTGTINRRELGTDPFGNEIILWKTSGDTISGGFVINGNSEQAVPIPFDNTKKYRFSVWLKRTDSVATSGTIYLGARTYVNNGTAKQSKLISTGAASYYFTSISYANISTYFPTGEWRLVVGNLLPFGTPTGQTYTYGPFWTDGDVGSGVYDIDGNYILSPGGGYNDLIPATVDENYLGWILYAPYQSTGMTFDICYPRIDCVDGTEPSLISLTNNEGPWRLTKQVIDSNFYPFDLMVKNNYAQWIAGTSGSTTNFTYFGILTGNTRVIENDFLDNPAVLWKTESTSETASGGFTTTYNVVDPTKCYRLSLWIKRTAGNSGITAAWSFYYGYSINGGESGISNSGSTRIFDNLYGTNFYFVRNNLDYYEPLNEWRLMVGYVQPFGTATGNTSTDYAGVIYDLTGGTVFNSGPYYTYCFAFTTRTRLAMRIYAPYNDTSSYLLAYPRIDIVDGTEPSIAQLIANNTDEIIKINVGDNWKTIT